MNYIYLDIETEKFFGDPELANMPREAQIMAIPFRLAVTDGPSSETWLANDAAELWRLLCLPDRIVVGFNIQQFDLPIIYRAADVSVPSWPRAIDLFEQIKNATGRWVKLGDVAQATLGRSKTADGKQAAQWLRDGEIEKVVAYCQQDVQLVKDLHELTLRGEPLILPPLLTKYKHEHEIRLWLDQAGQWSRYEVRR
jgi:hypothetical protein